MRSAVRTLRKVCRRTVRNSVPYGGNMSDETKVEVRVESPPVAAVPVRQEVDPRARLHELARELVRTRNRRVMLDYLRMRRAVA